MWRSKRTPEGKSGEGEVRETKIAKRKEVVSI